MSALHPHLPSYPEAIANFIEFAPERTKAGAMNPRTIVKRPPADIGEQEGGSAILTAWNLWWEGTEWAREPSNPNPNWQSPVRYGPVWSQYGEGAEFPNGHPHVYCLNCGQVLQHPSVKKAGTKHLINHLDCRACKAKEFPVHQKPSRLFPPGHLLQHPSSEVPAYSSEAFEKELVRAVIDSNWPFRTLERQSFQRFLQFLRPGTTLPSRCKFSEMLESQFSAVKAARLNSLGRSTKVSIALDA